LRPEKLEGTGARTLAQTQWILTAWSNKSYDPSPFNITADFSEKRMTGSAPVNMYDGSYTATPEGGFKAMDVASTLKGGAEEAMRAEALYFNLLQQASRHAVKGKTLTLKDKNNHDLLIFKAR
jgi:heat shock protein HslJ